MPKASSTGTTAARKPKTPRKSTAKKKTPSEPIVETPAPAKTLVLDNGGDSVRYGWSDSAAPDSMPNMTARLPQQWTILVGDQVLNLQNPNLAAITRSTERGIIHNLGNQVQVWKRILDVLRVSVPLQSEAATVYGWKPTTPAAVISSTQCAVLIGLAPLTPRCMLEQIVTVWMEDFGFAHVGFYVSSVAAARPSMLAMPSKVSGDDDDDDAATTMSCPIACVVDLGWSTTHIVPVYENKILALRRVPIGGRHLVELWKYYITYRQWNLMDQDFVVQHILEHVAMVALDFNANMQLALRVPAGRRPWDRTYVLPDYDTTREGVVQIPESVQRELERQQNGQEDDDEDDDSAEDEDYIDEDLKDDDDEMLMPDATIGEQMDASDDEEDEDALKQRMLAQRREEELQRRALEESQQVLRISTERFAVPEVLFRPQDAGLPPEWAGLPTAIVQAIQASPEMFRPALYLSIQLVGGLSQLPNLQPRLEREVRLLAPDEYDIRIEMGKTPTLGAWHGAQEMAQKKSSNEWSVSRGEWFHNRGACRRLLVKQGGCYM